MRLRKLKLMLLSALILVPAINLLAKEIKEPDSYSYKRGVEAANEFKFDEAEEWFGKELNEHPDNGYAYMYLAMIAKKKEQPGNALSALDMALKRLPKKDKDGRATAYYFRGNINAELNDTAQALEDYATALKLDPGNMDVLKERGDLYFEMKNYDLSDSDFRKIVEAEPGNVIGYMGLGRNALRQEHTDEAIQWFEKAAKMDPSYSLAYSFRAEANIEKKNWREAVDDIIKALDTDADDKAFYLMTNLPPEGDPIMEAKLKVQMAKQPMNAYWPFCLGSLAQSNEDYGKAVQFYAKANEMDTDPGIMTRMAVCYNNLRRFPEALEYLEKGIAMTSPEGFSSRIRAEILSNMGRFEECLAERDRLVADYPEYAQAYIDRGEAYMTLGEYDKALEDYKMAEVLSVEVEEWPYLIMKRGDALRLSGKKEEAEAAYRHMIELEKDSALTAESWIPFAYSGLGEKEKALEAQRYIVANDTTDVSGNLYNLACLYARLGMNEEALATLGEAINKGYKSLHMRGDYDLKDLRDRPEFKQMIEDLIARPASEEPGDSTDSGREETVEVPFTKELGVTKVKCAINDLPLHFVFDTGASDVTISMVEANFMLKNDYIKSGDIIGTARYIDANGDVTEGTVINLRKVNFGGLELDKVRASVVRNQKAPLLLGQSVLGRLGKIEIDNANQMLKITHRVKE
ncbi:MAG: tetratricopeptide repeat protein [Muribaculaceae bacterium]|nr:tetratricopeptide repeat protein [Muribaculaceae bacterium]